MIQNETISFYFSYPMYTKLFGDYELVLNYNKTKEVHVFQKEKGEQYLIARLVDMFYECQVQMEISKSMEIKYLAADFKCEYNPKCKGGKEALEKLEGRKIGSGITKMVYGIVGKSCPFLASTVMECIEGAILGVTAGPLEKAVPQLMQSPKNFTKEKLIKFMPHMKNSCIAYTLKEET